MSERNAFGLNRRQLEDELGWILRRTPKDAAELPAFLGKLVITLIEKNNKALAKASAERDQPGMPEGF